MDINEMAKTMTREEFMNKFTENKYILVINKKRYCCPDEIGLKILGDGNKCWTNDSNNRCKECWENAIKNIKFKGEDKMSIYNEDMLEKVLEGRNNKILVHFNSREEFKSILKLCEDRRIRWNMGEYIQVKNDLTIYYHCYENKYIKIEDNETTIGELNSYKGYEIIEYKDLLKIDYDKEYTIQEIYEFEEGTEFVTSDIFEDVVKIKDKIFYIRDISNKWNSDIISFEWVNIKFKLKKPEVDCTKGKVYEDLSKIELLELLEAYDSYIQDANYGNLYLDDWKPVCISEFYMNDFEHWRKNDGENR